MSKMRSGVELEVRMEVIILDSRSLPDILLPSD